MANTLQDAVEILADEVVDKTNVDLFRFRTALSWTEIIAKNLIYKALILDDENSFYTVDEKSFLLKRI